MRILNFLKPKRNDAETPLTREQALLNEIGTLANVNKICAAIIARNRPKIEALLDELQALRS